MTSEEGIKMNRKLKVSLLMVIILGSSLVGCGTTKTTETSSHTQEASVEQDKMQWMYSNLIDSKTQAEVKEKMIAAGISKETADIFIEWVNEFNSGVEEAAAFKEGFTLSNGPQVNYDDVYLRLDENVDEYSTRMDTNCRLTAGLLIKDLVEVGQYDEEADNYLMFDIESIKDDSKYEMLKQSYQKFITLFNPVVVQEGSDLTSHIAQIQEEWQKRNITFKEDTGVSLVTLFLHDPYENKRFVGHTGVLIEDADGLMLIEKYASVLPYQVTKFNSEQEVADYLLSRTDIVGDSLEEAPIVMRNTTVISSTL